MIFRCLVFKLKWFLKLRHLTVSSHWSIFYSLKKVGRFGSHWEQRDRQSESGTIPPRAGRMVTLYIPRHLTLKSSHLLKLHLFLIPMSISEKDYILL